MKHILLTPGEPAGVGPEITVQIAQQAWPAALTVIADPTLLQETAARMQLPLTLHIVDENGPVTAHIPQHLNVLTVPLVQSVVPGQLNKANAAYVLTCLDKAIQCCLKNESQTLVTGPVHKGILNEAGFQFSGHTEFLTAKCGVKQTVMLFVVDALKVALATTHLPLSQVSQHITQERLRAVLTTLRAGLLKHFNLDAPRIAVCGLNPHAGEGGHLGREEIEIITPLIQALQVEGYALTGPWPADTIFLPQQLQKTDAILAMYHDQALPVIKHIGFDRAVNVTLGLPFLRTSVDHGTALDIAGQNRADASSLRAALKLAIGC